MKSSHITLATILTSLTLLTSPVQAETIKIGLSKQASSVQDVARPTTGMSKADVEAKFGAPQSQQPAVGEPPISKWEYANFSVYFEGDTVLHSVLHHRPVVQSQGE